jgi:hypothetical protein
MLVNSKSFRTAVKYQATLAWAAGIPAFASLIGSWGAPQYHFSMMLVMLLGLTAAWATICHHAEGLVRGRVLNLNSPGLLYLIIAIASPTRWPLIIGILAGTSAYLFILACATARPRARLVSGDRFYVLAHSLDILVPLAYLAPQPLSPIFEPVVAMHWTPGAFGIPIWHIALFDPMSIHDYLQSRAPELSMQRLEWNAALTRFRKAMGLLSLLDSLRRIELYDLDGVALAASARLAISRFPETAIETLRDALMAFTPVKRQFILDAFDLEPG